MEKPLTAVYIMANKPKGTLYCGVTHNLTRRCFEHRNGIIEGFTTRYGCKTLVWYQLYEMVIDAIAREKQIKRYNREWKIKLIERLNPEWRDLYNELI